MPGGPPPFSRRHLEIDTGMLDLHSHILPGLDDGASDNEQGLAMARIAVADGIEGIVCTPHWTSFQYEGNTRRKVMEAVAEFSALLEREEIPLKVYPGTELRVDSELPRKLEARELLTINDSGRYALIELHPAMVSHHIEQLFWELQLQEITPILAHPERNAELVRDPARLLGWVEMGILLQVTSSSLLGRFGSEIQRFCNFLLEHNMVHIIASDAHGFKSRQPRLLTSVRAAGKIVGAEAARRMVDETPQKIINGEPVSLPDPLPLGKGPLKLSIFKKLFSFFRAAAVS